MTLFTFWTYNFAMRGGPPYRKQDMEAKYSLNDEVALRLSQERGLITGLASYIDAPTSYRVEFLSKDGRLVVDWFTYRQLVAV